MQDFTIPALPEAGGFPRWKDELYLRLVTASKRPDHKAMEWASKAEQTSIVPESELARSGKRFQQLDYMLAEKLRALVTGELKRQVYKYVDHVMRTTVPPRPPNGREILRIIVNYYATSETQITVVTLMDFLALQICGKQNSHLERFITSWESLLSRMTRPLDARLL